MRAKIIISCSTILIMFSLNFGTSLDSPIYYKYRVSGFVMCFNPQERSNLLIKVFGKSIQYQDSFIVISNPELDWEVSSVVTDSSGYYNLAVNSPYFLDSIKVGIIQTPMEPFFSQTYFILEESGVRIISTTKEIRESSGCTSCGTQPVTVVSLAGYEYNISPIPLFYCN